MKRIPYADLNLGQVLGTGTVGTVYLTRLVPGASSSSHFDLDEFAVKVLRETISEDVLVRARFRREMDILDRLQHPHIIRYLGGGEHQGQLYFAMELVPGGNLRDMLERFSILTWQEAASIGRQVCSALQHAHNFGIIHRDLKPSNLFLDANAWIKLGDFGIARDTNMPDLAAQGITVGTHAYMSPEQITGSEHLDQKADLYSLGCVLFELLTGRPPFEGPDANSILEQHLRKPAPTVDHFVAGCPPALVRLVGELLRKSPDERPFNARTVQGVLQELLASQGSNAEGISLQTATTSKSGDSNDPSSDTSRSAPAEVLDPGHASLVRKLHPDDRQDVSWTTLVVLASVVLLILVLVATASA